MPQTKGTHTPGPWEIAVGREMHGNPHEIRARRHAPGETGMFTVAEIKFVGVNEEKISNARLIAAAPELLALLSEVADHARRYGAVPKSANKLWDRVEAAIAKAEGRTNG